MSKEKKSNLPQLADLIEDDKLQITKKSDEFNWLLNQEPPNKWIKTHPYIKDYDYIPVDKVEYLLKKIFKRYKIEITGQGQAFNGVWVTVRIHYIHPIHNEWDSHDGIGAIELQTKKGASPADMANINTGAIGMAFPIAKSRAKKNAASELGKMFGSDLNREDTLEFKPDENLQQKTELESYEDWEMLKESVKIGKMSPHRAIDIFKLSPDQMVELQEMEKGESDA